MSSGALTRENDLRTYTELRRGVEAAMLHGQREIEAAKVLTYWKTGRLISDHLRLHESRPEYGAEVMARLARDLKISDTVLYRCVGFVHSFPILAARPKLSWAHYRVLLPIEDGSQRKALERSTIKNGWTSAELEERVRRLRLQNGPPPLLLPGGSAAKPLTPKRGTPGIYRLAAHKEGLAVDLGFTSFLDLTPEQARGLEPGGLVRMDAAGRITVAEDAKTSDLYTYRADVLRVVDGDTLWMEIYLGPRHWLKEKLRLRGLDCPEMDTLAGKAAKLFVETFVRQAPTITITTTKPDKYDRYLSDVFLATNAGEELFVNNLLLENGHAMRKDSYALSDWDKEQ